jgi:hypothetical protein
LLPHYIYLFFKRHFSRGVFTVCTIQNIPSCTNRSLSMHTACFMFFRST